MLRWLRFLLYAALLVAGVARHGPAIRAAVVLLLSPMRFSPAAPCLGCALALAALAVGYGVWLAGATLHRWKMPLWTHLFPLALIAATLRLGPLPIDEDAGGATPAADRALTAMRLVRAAVERPGSGGCANPREIERAVASSHELLPTGYRAHGRAVPFQLEVAPSGVAVREPAPGARPGSLYLACEGSRFWISAAVIDGSAGKLAMVRDGVGKVVMLAGEVSP